MDINSLLKLMVEKKSSDLHVSVGNVPIIRIDGRLVAATGDILTAEDLKGFVKTMMSERQQQIFEREHEYDFSYENADTGRFRVNIFLQRGRMKIVIRAVNSEILRFSQLGMPPILEKIAENQRGLILVTGTTGSGKSTTLAAIINHINSTRSTHIITVEDPIEYIFKDKKSIISQRELGFDTANYSTALRQIVRQDPDVILIGEMRDLETTSAAITAAQTGHLVLSTLHTIDAIQTVSRIIDMYPPHQQSQVRFQIADTLKAVISQRLLPEASGKGRVVAAEILVVTSLIKKFIMENDFSDVRKTMEEKGEFYGMQTFNQALEKLCIEGRVKVEEALAAASNPEELMMRLKGIKASSDSPFE
jgi:twitching motility protein PilT